jgi:hypothetical protein
MEAVSATEAAPTTEAAPATEAVSTTTEGLRSRSWVAGSIARPEAWLEAPARAPLLPHLTPPEGTLPRLLKHSLALLGRCALPLLAQLAAPLGRQTLKPTEVLAHGLLLLRRQRAELPPALHQQLPPARWQRLPALEALPRRAALGRRHLQPAVTSVGERLLPFRRQAIPLRGVSREQTVLVGR